MSDDDLAMYAMNDLRGAEFRIDQARTIILAALALMPNHALLAEQWESWRRDAERWLDK